MRHFSPSPLFSLGVIVSFLLIGIMVTLLQNIDNQYRSRSDALTVMDHAMTGQTERARVARLMGTLLSNNTYDLLADEMESDTAAARTDFDRSIRTIQTADETASKYLFLAMVSLYTFCVVMLFTWRLLCFRS